MYHVEVHVMRGEVEHFGKDRALLQARNRAWNIALVERQPERSIRLVSSTVDEFDSAGPYAYRCRFDFSIDGD